MTDEFFEDSDEMLDESEEDVASLLKSMQQQLNMLERKLDMLISNTKERSFRAGPPRDRPFRSASGPRPSRPSRPFERSDRNNREDRDRGPRERDSSRSHYSERRKNDKFKGDKPKKKPFYSPYKSRE
jgi:hypothetical protein